VKRYLLYGFTAIGSLCVIAVCPLLGHKPGEPVWPLGMASRHRWCLRCGKELT
jgi:hypothetical protein